MASDVEIERALATLRRTPSGEWLAERQNSAAEHSSTAIPGK